METTFSAILHRILQENDISLMRLYKDLYDVGMNITYPSLYAYYTGVTTPPYSVAKKIVKHAKMSISNEELEDIINYTKATTKAEKDSSNSLLNMNIKIRPKIISEEFEQNASALKTIIELRTEELFSKENEIVPLASSGKKQISAYIAYLIKKDLKENNLI